jgi:glycosyltransferase involved in cell wall biosynthesis
LRILLSAYACEPGNGSEPGVGWSWAEGLSQEVELTVITRANNRPSIEACEERWVSRVTWVYYDLSRWLTFWKRGARGTNLYYWLWQFGAVKIARRIHKRRPFEIFHHVTFGRYWVASMLAPPSVPFVFGPVGGGEDIPISLLKSFSLKNRLMELLRNALHYLCRFDPFLRAILGRKSTVTVAATLETEAKLALLRPNHVVTMPQCCLDAQKLQQFRNLPSPQVDRFRIVSIGRLVPWKGYHLALKAFAQLLESFPDAEYWLINDGPDRNRLENLAATLCLSSKVKFCGRLSSLEEVHQTLGQCDVLLHPALRESFGNVCLEAMAAGRPVVCLAAGGPGMQVTPEVGIAVPPTDESATIGKLSEALAKLAGNPVLREQMGRAAQLRAKQHFSQDAQITTMLGIYQQLLKQQKGAVLWSLL